MSTVFHTDALPIDKAAPSPEISRLPCRVHAPGEATARRVAGERRTLGELARNTRQQRRFAECSTTIRGSSNVVATTGLLIVSRFRKEGGEQHQNGAVCEPNSVLCAVPVVARCN